MSFRLELAKNSPVENTTVFKPHKPSFQPTVEDITEEETYEIEPTTKNWLGEVKKNQTKCFAPSRRSSINPAAILPTQLYKGSRLQELFLTSTPKKLIEESADTPKGPPTVPPGHSGNPDEPSSSDDDSDFGDGPKKPGPRIPYRGRKSNREALHSTPTTEKSDSKFKEQQFDFKQKVDVIPEWDGNEDTLSTWILKVNALASRTPTMYKQLGQLVPTRLRKGAEAWYYSLPISYWHSAETDWGSLRTVICAYYMNRAWVDRQKARANKASYRESGHTSETPSEYYIRKSQMLLLVFDLIDSEIIMEVMNGAPTSWTSILIMHLYDTVVEFQSAIKFHERTLILSAGRQYSDEYHSRDYSLRSNRGNSFQSNSSRDTEQSNANSTRFGSRRTGPARSARTFLVGWSPNLGKPSFPKDDSVVSKGKTPTDRGARPCRHCGSGNHWDNECKYSRQGAKQVRANFGHMRMKMPKHWMNMKSCT